MDHRLLATIHLSQWGGLNRQPQMSNGVDSTKINRPASQVYKPIYTTHNILFTTIPLSDKPNSMSNKPNSKSVAPSLLELWWLFTYGETERTVHGQGAILRDTVYFTVLGDSPGIVPGLQTSYLFMVFILQQSCTSLHLCLYELGKPKMAHDGHLSLFVGLDCTTINN